MSIFKKREQNRIINQDETTEIPVYGPHDTLCAQNYKIPYLLASFEERFEERYRAWLKNAKPDRYNRGYMDLLIDQLENEAFQMLDLQEIDHRDVIYELVKIGTGDQIKAEAKLAATLKEKDSVEQELQRLEHIFYKGTAYESHDREITKGKEEDYE